MEQNDPEALEIWNWFKEISMVEFERIYDLLGISFDSYLGESFYRDKVPALVDELKEKATYVTTPCDQDGIYNACVHFGWIQE